MAVKARWRKKLLVVGIGCFSLVVLAVGVFGIALIAAWMSYSDLGTPEPEATHRTFSLAASSPELAGPAGAGLPAAAVTRLTLDLEGGVFEVRPGPPGSAVTVEGTYAARYYELIDERKTDGELGQEITIRFRPTASILVRTLAGLNVYDDKMNQLTVTIPEGMPIDLDLHLVDGQSKTDLGGLLLTDLDVHLSKGAHHLGFGRPLAAELARMSLSTSMGDFRVNDLGNARFRMLETGTRMGSCRIDLGGEWAPGSRTEASFSLTMGDLTLFLPKAIRVSEDSSNMVIFGGTSGLRRRQEIDDPDAPELKLDLSTSMGSVHLSRY